MNKILIILAALMLVAASGSAQRAAEYYALYDYRDSVMRFHYDSLAPENALNLSNDKSFKLCDVKKIVIDSSMRNFHPDSCRRMFRQYSGVTEIVGLENLNPPLNGDMSEMFSNCSKIEILDLRLLNTKGVKKMNGMFWGCESLETIDVSGFDTKFVTDMSRMFQGCEKLKSLYLSNFDTYNVVNMGWLFKDCYAIDSLDLRSFNTEKVYRMQNMFDGCRSLTYVDVSSFNTENVGVMSEMFAGCSSLKTIDLSNFVRWHAYTNYSNIDKMFAGCTSLRTIYASCDWNMDGYSDHGIFTDCYSLYGGRGSHYLGSDNGDVYARIDKGAEQPGYFTVKGQTIFCPKEYAVLKDSVLTFYYSDTKPDDYYLLGGYGNDNKKVKEVVFDKSFNDYYPKSCLHWFGGFSNLQTISGMKEYLNTDSVTIMTEMFYGCRSLISLDLSEFNTTNVCKMNKMFEDCNHLKTIFVSNDWETDSVNNSYYMFAGCFALYGSQGTHYKWIEKTNEYKNYARIDGGENNPGYFTAVGQQPYEPPKATVKERVREAKPVIVPMGIDSSRWYCDTIRYGNDFEFVTEPYLHNSIEADSMTAYAILKDSVLTFYYDNKMPANAFVINNDIPLPSDSIPEDAWNESLYDLSLRTPQWNRVANSIKKVVFDPSFKTYRPKSCYEWFSGCCNLTEIVGIKENLNTEDVVHLSSMFLGCINLKDIDLSVFNTHNVRNMHSMFSLCMSLENIDLSSFRTGSLQQMALMFDGCWNLKNINFGNFNTSNVKNMGSLFFGCKSLKNIDLRGFNMSKCKNFSYMFAESGITQIDMSVFDTRRFDGEECLEGIFEGCKNLETLDVGNLKNSVYDKGMFFGCCNLKQVKLFSPKYVDDFYYYRTGDLSYLFYGCSSLEELDLSVLKEVEEPRMTYMFANCTKLKTIYVSDNWEYKYADYMYTETVNGDIIERVVSSDYDNSGMFLNCYNLTGGAGTKYNSRNRDDETFAKIDYGINNPGYFTYKTNGKINGSKKILIPTMMRGRIFYDDKQEKIIDESKWGYVNEYGEWIIMPQYDWVKKFDKNGIAEVSINGKTERIDKDGNIVIELFAKPTRECSFDGENRYEPNPYAVYIAAQKDGKYGYKIENNFVIEPQYDYAWNFDKYGYAQIKINGKLGFIDSDGNVVCEPTFNAVAEEYWQNCPTVSVMVDGKWGFFNKIERYIIVPKFDKVYRNFNGGFAQVIINDKIGIIDEKGKYVIEPMFDDIANDYWKFGLTSVSINGKYGFIDSTMKIAIEPIFENCSGFGDNGLAAVKLGDKWGYINTKGKFVIKPKFDDAWKFYCTMANVKLGNQKGLINKKGKYFLLPCDSDYDVEEHDFTFAKIARITKKNQYSSAHNKVGLINLKGKILFDPKYSEIKFFEDVILAKEGEKWGIIDKNGEWICKPKFAQIGNTFSWEYD